MEPSILDGFQRPSVLSAWVLAEKRRARSGLHLSRPPHPRNAGQPFSNGGLYAHARMHFGRMVGNPETDGLPVAGSISEWLVIRPRS